VLRGGSYPLTTTSSWAVADDALELVDMNADGCADVVASVYGLGAVALLALAGLALVRRRR
jgi:hypothetical protein